MGMFKRESGVESKVPDAYSGYPMYCILQGIQLKVGHDLIDHVSCVNTSMPEHEAVPLSHKACVRIGAVTLFDLAKTEHDLSNRVLPYCSSSCIPCNVEYIDCQHLLLDLKTSRIFFFSILPTN